MLPEIEQRLSALEERRTRLLEGFAQLSAAQLAYRPKEGAWGLLEVAEHLLIAERGATAAIERRSGKAARRTLKQKLLGQIVAVVIKLGIKVKAPSRRLEPAGEMSLNELREQWDGVGVRLRETLGELTAAQVGAEAFKHPIAGPLDFRQGLDFLNAHFDHHLRQVGRIQSSPGFAAAADGG